MSEDILAQTQHALEQADAEDLLQRCVDCRIAGASRWETIHRWLNENEAEADQVPAPVVKACVQSKAFTAACEEAKRDPEGWQQKRMRDQARVTRLRRESEHLASRRNPDKRTRTTNIQFLMGLAGYTPQTQVAVGPNEEFLKLVQDALKPRNGDPKAIEAGND